MYKCWNSSNCRLAFEACCWNTELITQSKVLKHRCWNTELLHSPGQQMLKHRAALQSLRSRRCWNTELLHNSRVADDETQRKLLHSPELQMLKHRGTARTDDAETQRSRNNHREPSTNHRSYMRMTDTVKSAIHVAETARELRCWNNISNNEKEAVTPVVTTIPHSAPVIAFCCVRLGHPILV